MMLVNSESWTQDNAETMSRELLTTHVILVCTRSRDRGFRVSSTLGKLGLRVIETTSIYEAERAIIQEMPHLIFSESILDDGNIGTLFDFAKKQRWARNIPFIVNVLKKTREELTPLAKRQFFSAILGLPQPKQLAIKIIEALTPLAGLSPFFIPSERTRLAISTSVSVDASILGISGSHVVSRSSAEIDSEASIVCIPERTQMGPALLHRGTNLKAQDCVFNLFPLNRILGKGRLWIAKLPKIESFSGTQHPQAQQVKIRVLFYEANEERFKGFQEILRPQNFELIPAFSLAAAARTMKEDAQLNAIFLHELVNDRAGIEWREEYKSLPDSRKLPVIIATSASNCRSTDLFRYLKRPFGLGHLLDALSASTERSHELARVAGSESGHTGIPVQFRAPCRLLGVDERGGILELSFPVAPGSILNLDHKHLTELWNGRPLIRINSSSQQNSKTGAWKVAFEAIGAEMSKTKYLEKLDQQIQPPPQSIASA